MSRRAQAAIHQAGGRRVYRSHAANASVVIVRNGEIGTPDVPLSGKSEDVPDGGAGEGSLGDERPG